MGQLIRVFWTYALVAFMGASVTVLIYETTRLVQDTSSVLKVAATQVAAEEPAASGQRPRAGRPDEPRVRRHPRDAQAPDAPASTEATDESTKHKPKFKMTDLELHLLVQRRKARRALLAEGRGDDFQTTAPLAVGKFKRHPQLGGSDSELEDQADPKLLDDEVIDTGLVPEE